MTNRHTNRIASLAPTRETLTHLTARAMLHKAGKLAMQRATDPACDVATVAEQLRQTADLILTSRVAAPL